MPEPFPTTPLLDTFNRANENPLASPWTSIAEVGGLQLTSNQVAPTAGYAGSYRGLFLNAEAWVTIPTLVAGTETILLTRYQDAGGASPIRDSRRRGYLVVHVLAGGYAIHRMDDGNNVVLTSGSFSGGTLVSGDSLGFRSVGGTHEAWMKRGSGAWTFVAQVTDSTYQNAGAIGLQSSEPTSRYDNFGGGEYAVQQMTAFHGTGMGKW